LRLLFALLQAGGHDLPARIQSPDGLMGRLVQDLGPGRGHQTNDARGDRWGHQLEPVKWRCLHGTEALRGAVEIRILAMPGMRIEARHRGFERWGWQVQVLRQLDQCLALRDPRQPRGVARWQAGKRVGVHQGAIEDQITRDIDKAVLAPGLEGMQLRPKRLEEIFIAKALPRRLTTSPWRMRSS